MKKIIGVFAHVDAGKTTFSEQLLYHAEAIRKKGRVDHGDTFLDSHPIEKQRGITVFSEEAVFSYQGDLYYLVDTPGHVDFCGEAERSIRILDAAVLLVSAVEGIQGHTRTLWSLLERAEIPVVFFINKMDRIGADADRVMKQIRELSENAVYWGGAGTKIDETLCEEIAQLDERLLETYLEHGYEETVFFREISRLIRTRRMFAVFSGSALLDQNIEEFMQVFSRIIVTEYQVERPFRGFVYKVRHENGKRVCFLKIEQGRLAVKEEIATGEGQEKIHEMRRYNGTRFVPVAQAEAGDLCGVVGLHVPGGEWIGEKTGNQSYMLNPALAASVLYDPALNSKTVLEYFRILEDEDPLLSVTYEEALEQIEVHIMGSVQMEILQQLLQERFSLKVEFGEPRILYRETITNTVIGKGHFEPLRHYAEVHLKMSPGSRGSGVTFSSSCHTDVLAQSYQNLIRTHIFEKEHKGVLIGAPLTDVAFELCIGRAHLKHTEGGDFREAVYRAVRQGLEKAESILLEPYYNFRIDAKTADMGRIIADIQRLYGTFSEPQISGDNVCIFGTAPVATLMNYAAELVAATSGTAQLSTQPGGYFPCHNQQQIIEESGYDPIRDRENTSDSVFCSHGAGYTVHWQEAEKLMHCTSEVVDN